MALRYALLGALADQPRTGYALLKHFEQSLAYAWPASHSQIYPELARLLADGPDRADRVGRAQLEDVRRHGGRRSPKSAGGFARPSRIDACAATRRCERSSSGSSIRGGSGGAARGGAFVLAERSRRVPPHPGRADRSTTGRRERSASLSKAAFGEPRHDSRGSTGRSRRSVPTSGRSSIRAEVSAPPHRRRRPTRAPSARGGGTRAAPSRARSRRRRAPGAPQR